MIHITGIRTDGAIALIAASHDLQIPGTTATGIDVMGRSIVTAFTMTRTAERHSALIHIRRGAVDFTTRRRGILVHNNMSQAVAIDAARFEFSRCIFPTSTSALDATMSTWVLTIGEKPTVEDFRRTNLFRIFINADLERLMR
jgi:hypothetical protein